MKNILVVMAGVSVVAGIVSVQLWRDLRSERQENVELRAELATPKTAAPGSATALQVIAGTTPAAAPAPAAETATCKPEPTRNAAVSADALSFLTTSVVALTTGSGEKDLMKDPEYRKAWLTQRRMSLAQSNPGLAESVGLSTREANQLFELMAENQQSITAQASSTGAVANPAAMFESMRRQSEEQETSIRKLLGDAKYAQMQDYMRDVRPALTQVQTMGSTLSSAGQPLNESQSRALASAIMTEQQRQRQEATLPRSTSTPGSPNRITQTLQDFQSLQAENNRRILEAASPQLSAAQLGILQEQLDQQAAMNRRTLDFAREREAPQPQRAPATAP